MTKERNSRDAGRETPETQEAPLSRRDFLRTGVAAGVGATVGSSGIAMAQPEPSSDAPQGAPQVEWDYEADLVIVGAGACGIPAAIRARDLGASVIVIDQNYDCGGVMLHTGGWVSLGGGDPIQLRDRAGERDPEGHIQVDPVVSPEALEDDVELLFRDMTDWSVVDPAGQAPYRYNDPEIHRAWAENCPEVRQFMMDNYVRFSRIDGTHGGGGMSRARAAWVYFILGDRTDMRAGTITEEDAGVLEDRSSLLAPARMTFAGTLVNHDAVRNGTALSRPLEFSAREKGVRFMLNRYMDELIREEPFSGRIQGIRASYTPRYHPETGAQLESYWKDGNIDERRESVTIRARKAVILGSGGHANNPEFRSMFYPAMKEPAHVSSGWALLGPKGKDASGIIAGLRVGANLSGMQQNLSYPVTFHISTRLATRDAYTAKFPGHPTFGFRGAAGISIGLNGFEDLIAVNQVGKRFYNEIRLPERANWASYPGGAGVGTPKAGIEHVPYDWRNSSREWVRSMYNYSAGVNAALAINEGSQPPDYLPGPIWAIFDQATLDRTGWNIDFPYTSDNGYFFRADTLAELAEKIYQGNEFQRVRMPYLEETVARWNSFVEAGFDSDFDRGEDAPLHRLGTPPYFAALIPVTWHDSYGGLRINGKSQVVDMQGSVIPGLYAGGEVAGGSNKHGLGKSIVQGYIAGTHAAAETG